MAKARLRQFKQNELENKTMNELKDLIGTGIRTKKIRRILHKQQEALNMLLPEEDRPKSKDSNKGAYLY